MSGNKRRISPASRFVDRLHGYFDPKKGHFHPYANRETFLKEDGNETKGSIS